MVISILHLKRLIIVAFYFVQFYGFAQTNLIFKPSFEEPYPDPNSQINWAWIPTGTPDHYSSIWAPPPGSFWGSPLNSAGYQLARSGNAYMGIITNINHPDDSTFLYSEHFRTTLEQSLKSNTCYLGGLYFVNGNYSKRFANRLGIYLSENLPTSTSTLETQFNGALKPQIELDSNQFYTDTLNWTLLSGVFKAKGGEKYVVYGNFYMKDRTKWIPKSPLTLSVNIPGSFYLDTNYAYVLIDDVFLYEIPSAATLPDTSLCLGQSVGIGLNNDTTTAVYNWLPSTGLSCTNCPNPIAAPNSNITYTLTKTVRGCSTQAKVSLTVKPKPTLSFNLSQNKFCVNNATLQLQGSPSGGSFSVIGPAHTLEDDLFRATQPGLFQFQYHYTDDKSCSNSSAFQNLWVYPLPLKPEINKKDSLLCVSRGAITLSASPTNGFYSGEGISGPLFKPNKPGSTSVYYTVSDNNNCSNSDTLIIKVLDCAQGQF
ncbi:MAG: hypothetical protein JNK73_15175, partial [Bacteroidia bacterium]|nr:hypothetical protein [Bacteroidia bacterium]